MEVALVGGGRWAKVLCNALSPFRQVDCIHVVSLHNAHGMRKWLGERSGNGRVMLHEALDDVLYDAAISAALVANLPAEHYATSARLLAHGKHVLVEKPFVPSQTQAEDLIGLAAERGLVLAVGLELFFADYLHRFRKSARSAAACELIWHDPMEETKWGVPKQPEATTGVVGDLLPHILTLLTVLFGTERVTVGAVDLPDGGDTASIELDYGCRPVRISLSRAADGACRRIELVMQDGARTALDFTREPRAALAPPPLSAELGSFLREIEKPDGTLPILAQNTLHIVAGTEAACVKARDAQVALLAAELNGEATRDPSPAALVALREHLAHPLFDAGLLDYPKDRRSLARWTECALHLIRVLACRPFATQRNLAGALGLDAVSLRRLNGALRACDFAQELILGYGPGAKYWRNTIVPLVQSGAVEDARCGAWRYPFRIGLYPGPSCMFFCRFCGRNYDARYPAESVPAGNALLESILASAPADDPHRFYVSGGLEPLTNPGLGDLVRFGARRGFKLSLYTNGYLLTPRLLERQPGLWELDTLRVSLYGVDAKSTAAVTRNPKSFERVVRNAQDFLLLRNERRAELKFGFNFVILPGCAAQVVALAELIAALNQHTGGRGVDFLTLREDYSAAPGAGIPPDERPELARLFEWLEARRRERDLDGLRIDYGYALHALRRGASTQALEMADHRAMRQRGYPQISVVVDLLGDVYLYREAGFLDRPGAKRYAIGRVSPGRPFEQVLRDFIDSRRAIALLDGDTRYFDIFDHVVTLLLNQADADAAFGIPFDEGPVRARVRSAKHESRVTLAHPTLS